MKDENSPKELRKKKQACAYAPTTVERAIPTEMDFEIITIDLSSLDTDTALNKRVKPRWIYFPTECWWNRFEVDGTKSLIFKKPRNIYDKSSSSSGPTYRNLAGQRVTPTRISSLLSQNPSGTFRPKSYFWWWNQTDEGYYKAKAKEGLPFFLAETQENYFIVDESSRPRL